MINKTSEDKYMGKGKDGLDDIDTLKEETNAELIIEPSGKTLIDEVQEKNPCFSEGYLLEALNPVMDKSAIKDKKHDLTPGRLLTNKLTTALKSSLRKCLPLDTELRFLSKEFRYLLSDKKLEAEHLQKMKQESIEKKLNFGVQENAVKVEKEEKVENDELMSDEDVEILENDILLKVLDENFGYKTFLPGQLHIIKNVLNGKRTLAILPPAGGKSLCFQLPSLVLEGLTIVISPLLSAISDQLMNLPINLSGASLSSFTTHKQRNEIFNAIKEKKKSKFFLLPLSVLQLKISVKWMKFL